MSDILKKAKLLAVKSGKTYHEIGILMGYPQESARQSVWQFLRGTNPSVAMVKRFATAIGAKTTELL